MSYNYEPVGDDEVIEEEVEDAEVVSEDEELVEEGAEPIEEKVVGTPDPALDLLNEFRNTPFRQAPPNRYFIFRRMLALKQTLYALIRGILWLREEIEKAEKTHNEALVKLLKNYRREVMAEYRYNVCQALKLALEAKEYYEKTGEMRGIEELVDLATYHIGKRGIPKYCASAGPKDYNMVLEVLRAADVMHYITDPETRDFIHEHFRIEKLIRIPRSKTEIIYF